MLMAKRLQEHLRVIAKLKKSQYEPKTSHMPGLYIHAIALECKGEKLFFDVLHINAKYCSSVVVVVDLPYITHTFRSSQPRIVIILSFPSGQ